MTIAQNHPQPSLIDLNNTDLQFSPEQFERLRVSNPDLYLELTEDGKLAVMSPTSLDRQMAASTVEVPSSSK
jgi:Uma2 family endonuclease